MKIACCVGLLAMYAEGDHDSHQGGDGSSYTGEGCSSSLADSVAVIDWGFSALELDSGHITVPTWVTSIPDNGFKECDFLVSITLHKEIISIGSRAFQGASNLREVRYDSTLNSGSQIVLNYIGSYAFYLCTSLETVDIRYASMYTGFGQDAFNGCESLSNLYLPDPNVHTDCCDSSYDFTANWNMETDVFYNTPSLNCFQYGPANFEMPCSFCTSSGDAGTSRGLCGSYAGQGCTDSNGTGSVLATSWGLDASEVERITNLGHVVVPDWITSIPSQGFRNCQFLESITLHEGVKSIGDHAFAQAHNLETVRYRFDGSDDCRCIARPGAISGTSISDNCDAIGSDGRCYDFTYGSDGCRAYDADDHTCGNADCFRPWCYVNMTSCSSSSATTSSLFPSETNLGYSYDTCDAGEGDLDIIGERAFEDCTSLETVDIRYANPMFTFKTHAFTECTSLSDLYLPDPNVHTDCCDASFDPSTSWNGYEYVFFNTTSLDCFRSGPQNYLMPCTLCGSLGGGSPRGLCGNSPSPSPTPTPTTTESTSTTTESPSPTPASGTSPSTDTETSDFIVWLIPIVAVAMVVFFSVFAFYMFSSFKNKQSRVVPVAVAVESTSEIVTPNVPNKTTLTKKQCMDIVDHEHMVWDKAMDDMFSLVQDASGHCERSKFMDRILRKRIEERENKKIRERNIGIKLMREAMSNANELNALPKKWIDHIVPKEAPKGDKLFHALLHYENILTDRLSLRSHEMMSFTNLLTEDGPAFFETRRKMYEATLSDRNRRAERQIAMLTTLLDARYKKTYDEIFTMQIAIGDKAAMVQWAEYAQTATKRLNENDMLQKEKSSLARLYVQGVGVSEMFRTFCRDLAASCGGVFAPAPMKHAFRALEKMCFQYEKDRRKKCGGIRDIIRGSIVFDNMANILKCAKALETKKTGFVITRFKDRFSEGNETSGGWRDAMFNGYMEGDQNMHIVEIQLQHKALLLVRSELGGHYMYSKFRSLVEALEVVEGEESTSRIRSELKFE